MSKKNAKPPTFPQLMEQIMENNMMENDPMKDILPNLPKGVKLQACFFVSATDLVPRGWDKWFWELISDNAPFSWGDNNRSMVTARDFANHCQERLDDSLKCQRFLVMLRKLGELYIDLES